jgi:hypothetical protein
MVVYDLDMFEHESSIFIEDKYGEQHLFAYHGEEIVSEVLTRYPITMIETSVDTDMLSEDKEIENVYNGHSNEKLICIDDLFDEEYNNNEQNQEDDIEY